MRCSGLAAGTRAFRSLMRGLLLPATARAEGYPAAGAERPPKLTIDGAKGFSVKRYEIETGRYTRWRVESDGRGEYKLLAPEPVRNARVDRVSIEDKEVKPLGGLHAVAFDDEGEIRFVPIRPGAYEFRVEGMRHDGMLGTFMVK